MIFCRLTAALLALTLFMCAFPALAEDVTMYAKKNTVYVYEKASSSSTKTDTIGEKVTVSKYNSSWAHVTYDDGDTGYCRTSHLTEKNPNVAAVDCYATSDKVSVYKLPKTSAEALTTLDSGDKVNGVALTPDKEWLRVEHNGECAYVQAKYFSLEAPQDAMEVYIKSTSLSLRHSASGSASKTGTAYFGEEFALTRLNGKWGYISNDFISGWCYTSSLSTKSLDNMDDKYYATKDGVIVYARSSKTLAELETLNKGEEVIVAAITPDGKYAMLECEDSYGYAEIKYLTPAVVETPSDDEEDEEESEPEEIAVYVSDLSAAAYASASTSAKKVGTVYYGEKLTCTAIDGKWAYVYNSTGKGWIKKASLATKDPCASAKTYYAKSEGAVVYATPSKSAKELGKLTINSEATVVGACDSWYRVVYSDGYGYIEKSSLTKDKPEAVATVYVNQNIVEAYKSSSSSSTKVGEVYYGQQLTRLTTSLEWALVTNGTSQGWVKKDVLTTTDPNTYSATLYVNADDTAVRKSPSAKGKKLGTLEKADVVRSVAITPDGEWVRIKYNTDYAYVAAAALIADSPAEYEDPYIGTASETIEDIAALAIRQYGKPYVYAEEGPDSYDCSGLMYYCFYKCAGITLRRSGHDQGYDERFPRITEISELKRGDVVVFDTIEDGDDYSDHTGLYLGGGLFIHASSSAGKVVVSDLSKGYYQRKFSWALRVIE